MYKISEIADLLDVEKTEIFAKLISHKAILEPFIKKVDGVTYFEKKSVEVLKSIFFVNEDNHSDFSIGFEKSEELNVNSSDKIKKRPLSRFEKERKILYDQIEILKKEIDKLDQEIEIKDDLLLTYQEKMVTDLETLNRYQNRMVKKNEKVLE